MKNKSSEDGWGDLDTLVNAESTRGVGALNQTWVRAKKIKSIQRQLSSLVSRTISQLGGDKKSVEVVKLREIAREIRSLGI